MCVREHACRRACVSVHVQGMCMSMRACVHSCMLVCGRACQRMWCVHVSVCVRVCVCQTCQVSHSTGDTRI